MWWTIPETLYTSYLITPHKKILLLKIMRFKQQLHVWHKSTYVGAVPYEWALTATTTHHYTIILFMGLMH
jgi:hypothetical protein